MSVMISALRLSISVILLSLIVSCKGDDCNPNPPNYYYYVDSSARLKIPFGDRDTLWFVKNGTDTIDFIGLGEERSVERYSHIGNCIDKVSHSEIYTTTYQSVSQNDFPLKVILENSHIYGATNLKIEFKYLSFSGSAKAMGRDPAIDSMTIQGRFYERIDKLFTHDYNDPMYYLLYSVEDGILQVHLGDEIWDRIEV